MGNTPGRNFLFVSGILLVVFASIALIVWILALIGILLVDSLASGSISTIIRANVTVLIISYVIVIIAACFNLAAGIIGIRNSNVLEKAQLCFMLAIAMMAIQLFALIFSTVASGFSILSLVGFVLPVLYLIGAHMNKNALAQPQQYPNQQYPNQQYPNQQYPNQQYPNQQYPNQQYPNQQYPNQQYPNQQYPNQQYPNQQYPNQQYPNQQYPNQ